MSFSKMLVEGIANELCGGKGHGASASRKLGLRETLLNELMSIREGGVKQVLRHALAESERGTNHLRDQLLKKQRSGASYAAIATFSKDFLVPWPGGRHLNAQARKTLAFQDAFFMHASATSEAINLQEREARIAEFTASLNRPDRKAKYLEFIRARMAALRSSGGGMSAAQRMTEANRLWRSAEENPNRGLEPQYLRHKRRRMRRELDGKRTAKQRRKEDNEKRRQARKAREGEEGRKGRK